MMYQRVSQDNNNNTNTSNNSDYGSTSGEDVEGRRIENKYGPVDVEDETSTRIQEFCWKNICCVIAVVLVLIISAMSGQMASEKAKQQAELLANQAEVHKIQHRPCQAYPGSSFVKVEETHRGEPANQWGEMPCLIHHSTKKNGDDMSSIQQQDSWNYWFFGDMDGYSSRKKPIPIEYARPSAEIQVDFRSLAHPDRQPIMGFGGAFTEASALNWNSLNAKGRKAVMDLLFGPNGLGYTLGRVHMNSCDFCVASYSFDDVDGDFHLHHFDTNVTHDVDCGMMDFMLQASRLVQTSWAHSQMNIMASPWSPPAWMKQYVPDDTSSHDNDTSSHDDDDTSSKNDTALPKHATNMVSSALPNCLKEGVGPDSRYAKTWALYFQKFITAYKNKGLSLFAVTVQNEPEFPAPWEACAYSAENERDFIANFLGPMLRESHPDVQLLIFDHNKDHAPKWMKTIMGDHQGAAKYVNGTAVHWYAGGMDRLLDGALGTPNMHRLNAILHQQNISPSHLILGSEACHCPSTGYAGGSLGIAWDRAQRYAHAILADLAAGSNGWIEWNLILDAYGGPNHLGNMCDSPLLAVPYRAIGAQNISKRATFEKHGPMFGDPIGDDRTREELNAFGNPAEYIDVGVVVQPMYYYMGHISRHVRPGSRAVPALVNQAANITHRTFRIGDTAGGGINDLAKTGIEVTSWPCEGSTRQLWYYDKTHKRLLVNGHDWMGRPTTSCLGKSPDESLQGVLLTSCDDKAGIIEMKPDTDGSRYVTIIVTNSEHSDGSNCLALKPLANNGGALGPRGGAQVTVGDCNETSAQWQFDESTGEISSTYFSGGEVCLTTGWPFLQVGAFLSPHSEGHKKVVIILNEAADAANFIVRDHDQVLVTSSIRPHAIQTLLFE